MLNGIYLIIQCEILPREGSPSVLGGMFSIGTSSQQEFTFPSFGRPVGSGKTALTLALCKRLRDEFNIGSFNLFVLDLTLSSHHISNSRDDE